MTGWIALLLAGCAGLLLAVGGWLRASKREGRLEEEANAGRSQLDGARRVLVELSLAVPRGRDLAARWRARMLHRDTDDGADPPVS